MMSDKTFLSMDTSIFTQRLQSAEKSIKFLQHEHASTLASLHEEITKWQQKFSDLTSQLAIRGPPINSFNDSKLRTTVEQLENELYKSKDQIRTLHKILEEKEKIINDYENRLTINDRNHALELHEQYDKQRELKMEVEQRSTLITQLTNQLVHEKQHQQNVSNPVRLGHIILPNKPRRFKNIDEQRQQNLSSSCHLSNRSSSISNQTILDQELSKVLFIGRHPPIPPLVPLSSIKSNDEQLFSKRQRQLLNSHTGNVDRNKVTSSRSTIKLSTFLPPIVNRKVSLRAMVRATLPCESEA